MYASNGIFLLRPRVKFIVLYSGVKRMCNPKMCHPGVSFILTMCSMLLRIKILVTDAFSLLLENQSPEECQNGQHGMHVGSLVEFQI